MSLTLTLILMIAGLALFAFSAWRSGRPWNPVHGPRMVPWTLICIALAIFLLLLLAHLLSFIGIETGQRVRTF
ncbi:hypothetical protein AB6B38_08130 [Glycocaulis abyssi]|uniref:Uncharacterized protein n=1 Tax=Glycocaulis abyssi TaxID=1433403 RepID=A0ABV9NCU2_9PROT